MTSPRMITPPPCVDRARATILGALSVIVALVLAGCRGGGRSMSGTNPRVPQASGAATRGQDHEAPGKGPSRP
jgi:hypothetical protein